MSSSRRVVITGTGAVTPIGLSVEEAWDSAKNGRSGVGPITQFDASDMDVKLAAELKNFDAKNYVPYKKARQRDRHQNMASAAAKEALEQSGLEINEENAGRVASIISSAIGGTIAFREAVLTVRDKGPSRVSPFGITAIMPNGAAGMVSIDHGIKGPAYSIASACASGADGLGNAFRLLREGSADAAVAGGTEAPIVKVPIAAFDRIRAYTRKNGSPVETPSPFSADRDGMVMGEGAAIMVLETLEHALKRGANILAELVGYSATADAYHVTAPAIDGAGGSAAIKQALDMAGLNVEDVDYISAHGTGTQLNDATETLAIKSALGEHAYNVPISSTKSIDRPYD